MQVHLSFTNQCPPNSDVHLSLQRWADDGGAALDEEHVYSDTQKLTAGQPVIPGRNNTPINKVVVLNPKTLIVEKPVYPTLAHHQASETDWDYHSLSSQLHIWFDRFNDRFRLGLPQVPLRLDSSIRRNCAGYFRPGHNEFGLAYEIAVAVPMPEELATLDLGDVLGTLLHEQLHLLQELTGMPGRNNYHNSQFRDTAERFGLLVDYRGHQKYSIDSPFLDLLAEYGVEPPLAVRVERAVLNGLPLPAQSPRGKSAGKSKLRKWSCGCTNVRVGVAQFFAKCTRPDGCGKEFRPCD